MPTEFSNIFTSYGEAPSAPSVSEAKKAILSAATVAKEERIDPIYANNKSLIEAANTRLAQAKQATAQQGAAFDSAIGTMAGGLQGIVEKYEPNSKTNAGKPYTAGQVEDGGLLSVPGVVNLGAGLKKGATDMAGTAAAALPNSVYGDEVNILDNAAVAADQKDKQNAQLQGQLYTEAAAMQLEVDAGKLSPADRDARLYSLNKQIEATTLTAEDNAVLDAIPVAAPLSGNTNRETLATATALRKAALDIPKTIDTIFAGTKHYQSGVGDKLGAKIGTEIADDVTILNKSTEAFKSGDYGQAAMDGLPALARIAYTGVYEGVKDPHGSAQKISEQFMDLVTASMGVLGLSVSAAESFGMATQMQAEGIEKFMAEKGRKPTPAEFSEITNWSYAAGALDMASDVVVSGAGKGVSKLVKNPAKSTIAEIRAAALNQTDEAAVESAKLVAKQGLAVPALKTVGSAVAGLSENAVVEGMTEGAQQVIDDYTSELRPIGDLKDAAQATAMGALVGTGMGPASKVVEASVKIPAAIATAATKAAVQAGATINDKLKEQAIPKSEEQVATEDMHKGRAAHGYTDAVKAAVESGDVSEHIDPEKKDTYRPILAVDALAEMNKAEGATYETKAQNLDQALNIQEEFTFQSAVRQLELRDLQAKKDSGESLTVPERKRIRELTQTITKDQDYRTAITSTIQSMNKTEQTADELKTALADAQDSEDPDQVESALKQIFGSASGGLDIALGSKIEALKAGDKLRPEVKSLVSDIEAFTQAKDKLTSRIQQAKSTEEVHNDVLHGSVDNAFKGIASYNRDISAALANGNESFANSELTKLSNFAQAQQKKAEVFRAVTNATPESPVSEEQQAYFNQLRQPNGMPYIARPGVAGWERTVGNVEHEADALTKSVAVAKGLFSLYSKPASKATPSMPLSKHDAALAKMTTTEATYKYAQEQSALISKNVALKPAEKTAQRADLLARVGAREDAINAEPVQKKAESSSTSKNKQTATPEVAATVPPSSEAKNDQPKQKSVTLKHEVPVNENVSVQPVPDRDTLRTESGTVVSKQKDQVDEPAQRVENKEVIQDKSQPVQEVSNGQEEREGRQRLLNRELTSRENDTDADSGDYREMNIIRRFFSARVSVNPSAMITTSDFFGSIKEAIAAKAYDEKAATLLGSMVAFHDGFSKAISSMFQFKDPEKYLKFRYKDPLQYLANDQGVLPELVVNAISAASYQWLATRGEESLFNNTRAIQKMLGVQKETNVDSARNLLKEVGIHQDFLAETLGQEIYRLMEIKPEKDAPKDFEARLIKALGLQAIASMEHNGTLKMTSVYTGQSSTGHESDGKYGIAALKSNIMNAMDEAGFGLSSDDNSFYAPLNGPANLIGKTVSNYYRIDAAPERDEHGFLQPAAKLTEFVEHWNNSKQIYDKVFASEQNAQEYSWQPVLGGITKLKKTTQFTTEEQADNVTRNTNEGWILSSNTATPFLALDQQSQLKIAGQIDPAGEHIDDRPGAEDANKGLLRQLESFQNWLIDAANQTDGLASKFYIPVEFYRNNRMGQRGSINPQNSKIHRYLFGMPAWESQIKLSYNKKGTLTGSEARLFEAIGLGLGVESGKKGGLKKAIAATQSALSTPAIAAAVQVLRNREQDMKQPGFKFTEEESTTLVTGVKVGGEKVKTFKALVEYSRYLNAKESGAKAFSTDIATEIDGMSNGPILMKMQFLFEVTKSNLAMLRNGGLTYTAGQKDVGEHLDNKAQMDTYEAGGMAWSEALESHTATLIQELKAIGRKVNSARALEIKQELARITAAKRLFGEFNDKEGFVDKVVRKLIKYRIVATEYGAGSESVKEALSQSLTNDTIRGKLKNISQMPGTTQEQLEAIHLDLKRLEWDVNVLANLNPKTAKAKDYFRVPAVEAIVNKDGSLNKESILSLQLPAATVRSIHDHLKNGHGKALIDGMHEIFGEVDGARKNFNLGFSIVTTLYNEARKIAVEARKAELDLPVVLVESVKDRKTGKSAQVTTRADLAIEEYAKIDAELAKIFPVLTTTFGGKMDMAKQSKDKVYSREKYVEQTYAGTIKQKTGYLVDPSILQMPGVSPMVMSIIMMDATISNKTQGDGLSILNCHDGFYTGLNNVVAVNQALNQHMYELMRDFDLAQTMYESVDSSVRAFNLFRNEHDGYATGKDTWDQALDQAFRTNFITESKFGVEKFDGNYETAISETLANMQNDASVATHNKTELLGYLQNLNQYYYPNNGMTITDQDMVAQSSISQGDLENIDTDSEEVVKERAANLVKLKESNTQDIKALFAEYVKILHDPTTKPNFINDKTKGQTRISPTSGPRGLAAEARYSSTTGVSMDESEYDPAIEVSGNNAVATYDQVKNLGTVRDTQEHDNQLSRILFSIVGKVMNPADMFMKTDANKETAGAIETGVAKNRIFISSQALGPAPVSGLLAQGIRMSTGEVYVHELVHAVTQHGLKINARLRTQVDTLYQLARKELNANGEGFTHFLPDPSLNINDPANAFEVQAAKDRWEYIFGDKIRIDKKARIDSATGLSHTKEYSQHLDEFMAYGLTNAAFIRALSRVQVANYKGKLFRAESWRGVKGANIQDTMVRLLNKITDMIMHNFANRAPEANMAKELESLAKRLAEIDTKHKTLAAGLLETVNGHQQKLATFVNGQIKGVFSTLDQKLGASQKATAIHAHYSNQNSAFGQMLRDYRAKIDGFNYGVCQAMGTSIKGLTDRVEVLHQLLNTRKIVIDQAREQATMKWKTSLGNLWSRKLTNPEKVSFLKAGIKTDLDALRTHFDMTDIKDMVDPSAAAQGRPTALETAMAKVNRQLAANQALRPYMNYYQKQARSLGHIMVHGRSLEEVSFFNARLIAGLYNTTAEGKLSVEDINQAEELVDQLASMYALEFTPGEHRQVLHALMDENMHAVESTLHAHRVLQLDAQSMLFNDNPFKIMKGYTNDIINPQIKITSAPLSEAANLQKLGFTPTDKPLPRDSHDPDRNVAMYLYINRNGATNDLAATIASFTGNHARGTNMVQNAMRQGQNPLMGVLNNASLLQGKRVSLNAMLRSPMVAYNQGAMLPNYMLPQVDDNGRITKYRYTLSDSVKDGLLERHNAYDDVLGSMAGTIPDKQNTTTINAQLINALKDIYDKEYATRHAAYIEISPFTANEQHRAIYHMLPEKAKNEMQQVWGEQKMFVAKDIVDLAFGTRKYSMLEAFAKDPDMRNFVEKAIVDFAQHFFNDKAITRVKQLEDILQGMTKMAKNSMIVKSFTTSFNNHISNLFYCKSKGVSYANIIRWKREATVGALKYQADKKHLDEMESRLLMNQGTKPSAARSQQAIDQASSRMEGRIRELKNELALNPVTDLMEAGLMQSIVDDVETGGVQSPFPSMVEKFTGKLQSKLPESVVNVGKVVFLAEDTQGYKILSNAVKMTDFIGRYIMYKHYMQDVRGSQKDRDAAHAKAVAQVIHEFVNFNLPDHRMVDYANSVGLLWYTRYATRVLKPFAEMLKDKPFEALTAFTLAHTLGMANVAASTLFLGRNPLDLIGNPLSAFLASSDDAITLHAAEFIMDTVTN